MSNYDIITSGEEEAWNSALSQSGDFDTYDLPGYNRLAEQQERGEAKLFIYRSGGQCAAVPFLLRRISLVEGFEDCDHFDATSAYGYPGIVASLRRDNPEASRFLAGFQAALTDAFRELKVISLFCRLNPLIETSWLLRGMAEVEQLGSTVAIDLKQSVEEQYRGMTKGHRYDIRKARREGVKARDDASFEQLDMFIRMYHETMRRARADDEYFFPDDYFYNLRDQLGGSLKLYVAEKDGEVISASLFLVTCNKIQYHLSGTPGRHVRSGGAKVILDEVRAWGTDHGFAWLHLGGGLGAYEDSLFRFKAGFSKCRLPFEVGKMVIEQELYEELSHKRQKLLKERGLTYRSEKYFPSYRQLAAKAVD